MEVKTIAEVRQIGVSILEATLAGYVNDEIADNLSSKALELEEVIYSSLLKKQVSDTIIKSRYHTDIGIINSYLTIQTSAWPEDIVGYQYLRGNITSDQILTEGVKPQIQPTPREIIRRMFASTLLKALGSSDSKNILKIANTIEQSCYNNVIRSCKESNEPPQRNWDSGDFVDAYSIRCGSINGLLHPEYEPTLVYGPILIDNILNGIILPSDLGNMTVDTLCPMARENERAEIAKRIEQKITLKSCNLFLCPRCMQRNCSYQEVQKRSLDEAPDYHCLCLTPGCNTRFIGHS